MANAIGKVAFLQGQVFARATDGSQRLLKVGDVVLEGDVLVTGPGARVELAFDGGSTYLVRENETVTLDNTVFAADLPDGRDAALAGDVSDSGDALTRALANGSSLDELLEAPAAGLGGGETSDSHSFVRLLRIVETVPAIDSDYQTVSGDVTPELLGAAARPDVVVVDPDAPQAQDDGAFNATEDTPLVVTPAQLLGNDTDPNGDILTITSVQGATHGTVALVGGNIVFTPAADYHGPASFTYTITDAQGKSSTATVTLNVVAVNDLPVAQNDATTTNEDTPVTITVRGNDSDVDGDALTVTAVTNGAHGTVALDGSGNPVYTPAANWSGTDSFTYTISDGHGGTATATVTVTVNSVNDTPDAIDDGILAVTEDVALTIAPLTLLGNDTDPDGNPLTITSVQGAVNGTVALVGGNVVFTPAPNYNGPASFTYTISDGQGGSDTATVSLNVASVNDLPVAQNDAATTNEDTPVTITVRDNDSDFDGDALTVTAVTNGAHGTVALDGSGNPVYTPAANWSGTDSFTYTVSDGHGGTSTATVTVTVNAVNDLPVAQNDATTTNEDTPVTITVRDNDSDVDGDALTVTAVTNGAHGTVALDGSGNPVYTPAANWSGIDSFTYTVSDGHGGTSTATVTVTVSAVNDLPVAQNDVASTAINAPVTVLVLSNDNDADGDTLTVTGVTNGAHGTVVLDSSGNPVYTPAANWSGTDSFTYTVSDGHGGTTTATVSVTVGANTPPTGQDATFTLGEDGSRAFAAGDFGFADADLGQTFQAVRIDSLPGAGSLTYLGNPVVAGQLIPAADLANLLYTPAANGNGAPYASFSFSVQDNAGGFDTTPNTVTLNVTPVNDLPVAQNDATTTNEDTPVTITVRDNDSDVDGDALTVTAVTNGAHGTVALDGSGNPVYTPAANWSGIDSFTYTVSDGHGGTSTATVTVTVSAVNDLPVAQNDVASTAINAPVTVLVLSNDNDADGDTLTVTGVTNGAHGTVVLDSSGNPVYTPAANWSGTDSFTYTVSDGHGGTTTATVSVTVGANTPPTGQDATFTLGEDGSRAFAAGDFGFADADLGQTFQAVRIDSLPGAGSLTYLGNPVVAGQLIPAADLANLLYTPAANGNGAPYASFSFSVQDNAGGFDTTPNTVTLNVTPVNDATTVTGGTSGAGNEDTVISGTLTATDADGLTDGTVYSVTGAAGHGMATINAATGAWSYTPVADWNGTDSFTVTITDDAGNSVTQAINVTVAAVADITNNAVSTAEDTALIITTASLTANDNFEGTPVVSAVGSASHGTVSLVGGNITYTPAANYNGTDSFTYTVTSGGVTETATVNVTITPVNDATNVTGGTSGAGNEDTVISGTLTATDADGLTDGTVYSVTGAAGHGMATINAATGAWSYTPVADWNGTDSFTVTITDDAGNSVTQAINVTVAAVADITNNAVSTAEDTALIITTASLTANDNFEGTPVVSAVGSASHGTVSLVGGNITYTPAANYNGTDSFTYTVTSGGVTETATVNVTITPVNDATNVTGGTSGAGNEDTVISGTLTATDADGLTDGTVYSVTGAAGHGMATINAATGAWSYTPVADWNGTDSFTVTITDDAGNSVTQAINVTVAAVADITNNAVSTAEDTALVITTASLLANDTFEGGTPVVSAVGAASHGTVSLVGGNITYTPAANYNGTDSFTYTVTSGGVTETATVNVTITPVNDATTVTGGTSGAGNEDTVISGTLTATDADGLTDGTVYSVTGAAGHGMATINAATGAWSYTPVADWNGTDSFTVTITDDAGNSVTQAINVTVAAVADITNNAVSTAEDTALIITTASLTANDNFEGTPVVSAVGSASHGTVSLVGGNITYTPAANYNGTDSFTYTVTSGGVTETATVNVTITPVNDATNVTGGTSGAGNEDTVISGTLTATDADGLTDGTVYTVTGAAGHGTATINAATGAWSYTPVADWNGTDSFTVTITDDAGNSVTQAINVTVAAVADITNNAVSTAEDTALIITTASLTANDNFEGTPVVSAVGSASHGTVSLVGGNITYTPAANYNGTDSFTYTVTSGGVTETATVNVTITPVNDATNVTGGTSGAGNEDTVISGTLTATDADGLTDGTVYTVTGAAGHGTATINAATGAWSYTPVADWNGTDSFTVTITDDAGNSVTQAINVTVAAVADITNNAVSTAEDTALIITTASLTANDNFEGTPVVSAVGSASHGTVSLVGGNITYTPAANYNGTDSFTYTVTSGGVTETATVNVTITPVNDATNVTGGTSGAGNEDTVISGTLTATDADGLTDGTVYTVTGAAGHGTATINAATGAWSYTPVADWNGTDSFTVTITDDAGNSVTQAINVTVAAVADITNNAVSTAEDTALIITTASLTANDNFEGTPVVSAVGSASHGTVSLVGGNITYTPAANYNGTDSFTYTVTSGGVTETATVNVTVNPGVDVASRWIDYWQFNEGSGTTTINYNPTLDQTGTITDATPHAGQIDDPAADLRPTWTTGRNGSSAIQFNGVGGTSAQRDGGWVALDTSVTDPLAGQTASRAATLSFWINTTQSGSDIGWDSPSVIGMENNGGTADIQWGFIDSTGRIGLGMADEGGLRSGTVINDGQWHQVTISHNFATGATYIWVDGVREVNGATLLPGTVTPNRFLGFGVTADDGTTSNRFLNAALEDVRIYDSVLSNNQAQAIYETELMGNQNSVIANDGQAIRFALSVNDAASTVLSGLRNGTVVTDGTHTATIGAAGTADISTWNASEISLSNYGTGSFMFNVTGTDASGNSAREFLSVVNNADMYTGTSVANTLTGSANANVLSGGAGNDTLSGLGGNDLLIGGSGNDTMTGGTGADVFSWSLADRGTVGTPASDTITDGAAFASTAGEALDLRDLLVGETHTGTDSGNLANYLHFSYDSGTNTTTINVQSQAAGVDQVINLQGVNLVGSFTTDQQIIQNLLNNGKLITD